MGDSYYQEWIEAREEIETLRELVRLLREENERLRFGGSR
jgi:hypothetical protein